MNLEILVSFALIIVVATVGFLILPRIAHKKKIQEWLVYMCYEAEKLFTEPKSGKLKLRYVYDAFINTFKCVSRVISFETFSKLVDIALVQMKSFISDIEQHQKEDKDSVEEK